MIWTVATLMAVSPHVFGLSFSNDPNKPQHCKLTDNLTYQLVSTLAAFYLPLVVMCIIYWKIFQSAKFRIRSKGMGGSTAHKKHNQKSTSKKKIVNIPSTNNIEIAKSNSNGSISKKTALNNHNNNNSNNHNNDINNNETSFVNTKLLETQTTRTDLEKSNELLKDTLESNPSDPMIIDVQIQDSTEPKKSIKKIIFKNKFLFRHLAILQEKTKKEGIQELTI